MKAKRLIGLIIIGVTTAFFNSSGYADESLSGAVKQGAFSGEAKIWYQTRDGDTANFFKKENSVFDAGIRLSYVTGTYKGFGVGVSFYAVDDLGAYKKWANHSKMGIDHSDTGTWLGEAYLTFEIANTSAKLGRQNINSPLVNSDTWPIFPNNFEAWMVRNRDIPDTSLVAGLVTKERWRGSETFKRSGMYDDDGIFMLGAVNKSIPKTTLSAYYYYTESTNEGDISAGYFEAAINLGRVSVKGQSVLLCPDGSGTNTTTAFGAMVSSRFGMFTPALSVSTVSDGTLNAAKLSDNGTKTPLYTSTIPGDGDIAGQPDTNAVRLAVCITPKDDLKIIPRYGYYDNDSFSDGDATTAEAIIKYTGIKNVHLQTAIYYSNHEGMGFFNGPAGENIVTLEFWARYMF